MESTSTLNPIYAKVQVLLERWPNPEEVERKALLSSFKEIGEMNLEEKGILSMADFAVGMAGRLLELWMHFGQKMASDLLCLLKPIKEKLLPSKGTADWRIWEIFAAAEVQRKQICVLASYASWFKGESSGSHGLAESPLVMSTEKKLADLVAAFRDVQSQLEGHISSELHSKMTEFTKELQSWCGKLVCWMKRREPLRGGFPLQWSWQLASKASEIARELRSLPDLPGLFESSEPGSWSLVEDTATAADVVAEVVADAPAEVAGDVAGDVESVASCWSVESQMSYLSGHGGPHCFLPPYLFQHVQSADESSSKSVVWAAAKDLQRGAKFVSADGDLIEVIKAEVQKTTKLVELELDQAVLFSTTPNHRIMVPSDGDDATVKAIDLKLGSWVMCSDGMAKKVIGMKLIHVESQEVLAITFHLDKAVACFPPPQEPLVLTKGLTPKPIRRGIRRGGAGHELVSLPDTAPGEYED